MFQRSDGRAVRGALIATLVLLTTNLIVPTTRTYAAGPVITATKSASVSQAKPGDAITYTVKISNTGSQDATGMTFTDTPDSNTSYVAGSLESTPIAINDSYSSIGNVGITVPAANGVLANDSDPDGDAVSVTSTSTTTTAQGGTLALHADGSFAYTPPAGFTGNDSFTYTIGDGHGNTDTATATIAVSGMIWFINNSAASNGNGTLASPFNNLSSFASINDGAGRHPAAGANIFIYSGNGSYTGGVTLLNNQKLIGQGATASLSSITGLTPPPFSNALPSTNGAKPVITNSGGAGVTVASGNLIQGVAISNTSGNGIVANGAAGLSVLETAISNTGANGVSLTNSSNISFDSTTIQNTNNSGIKGTGVSGFSFTNGSIANSGVTAGGTVTGALQDSNIAFNNQSAGTENNISGTVTITGNTFTNAYYHGVSLYNYAGTLDNVTISNNTITSSTSTSTSVGSGIQLIAFGSASAAANVTKATITNNTIQNFPSGAGIQLQGGNSFATGPGGTFGTPNSSTNIITVTGNSIAGQSAANPMNTDAILVSVQGGNNPSRSQGNFNISNNGTAASPLTNVGGNVISVSTFGDATVTAAISNNVIVANNTFGSQGIGGGTGSNSGSAATPNMNVTVTGNNISKTDGNGILLVARSATGTLNASITNNTVAAPLAGHEGIRVDAGNSVSVNDSVCLNISGNTTAGGTNTATSTTWPGIGLRKQGTSTTTNAFGIVGLSPSPTGTPNVENYVNAHNTSAAGTFGVGGTDLISAQSGFTSCSLPAMPAAMSFAATSGLSSSSSWQSELNESLLSRPGIASGDRAVHVTGSSAMYTTHRMGHRTVQNHRRATQHGKPARGKMFMPDAVSVNGNTITVTIGTLPAGKSVTLTFQVTVNNSTTVASVSNQGTVSGTNFSNVLTNAAVTQIVIPTTTAVTSSTNPSTFGDSVTFTATVSATAGSSTPTGSVQFQDNGSNLGSPQTLNGSGVATLTTSSLSGGSHTITAVYGGQGAFQTSTGTLSGGQTVNKASTTTTLISSQNPSVYGQSVTFTATITAPSSATAVANPAGTVDFFDGNTKIDTETVSTSNGVTSATFTTGALSVGSHTITATYNGDTNYSSSSAIAAQAVSQTVNKASSSTNLSADNNPSVTGQAVTFTATVSATAPGAGTPTGTVQFQDNGSSLGSPQTLTNGVATLTVSTLSVGSHRITAIYRGDSNFTASSSPALAQVVNKADTTTTITANTPNPSRVGQAVTVNYSVTASSPGGGTPTGNVTVTDGVDSCTGTVAAGSCSITLTTVGNRTLTATYAGDSNYNGSTSAGVSQTVNKTDTTTTITAQTPNPSVVGQAVIVQYSVSPDTGSGTPTGNVTVTDGTVSCTATVAAGQCSLTFTSAGSKSLTATYGGDSIYNGSTSASKTQTVNQASTSTSLASSSNPSAFGQDVTFTATITVVAPGAGTPTGTVDFFDSGTNIGTGTVSTSNGVTSATFSTSSLSVGSHTITATYSGDANYSSSSATGGQAVSQQVNQAGTNTDLTSDINPTFYGQPVTFTATVSANTPGAGTPTGTVQFQEDGTALGAPQPLSNGVATLTTSSLSVGSHRILAVYSGDSNFTDSTSGALTQQVTKAEVSTSVTSSQNPSTFGQSVMFTAKVSPVAPGAGTPTGTVTFYDGSTALDTETLAPGSSTVTFTTSSLSGGSHVISATYNGDSNFNASTVDMQLSITQEVDQASTTTTLASSPNPSAYGQSVTFTATITAPPSATAVANPTGTVTFYDDGSPIGTGKVSTTGGVTTAGFSTGSLSAGPHTITATYNGDANYNGSSATGAQAVTQQVTQASTTTKVASSVNPSAPGQSVSFTATVTSGAGTPTGTVQFAIDGTNFGGPVSLNGSGQATSPSISTLSVGPHAITATYSGDSNFGGSSGSLTQTVSQAGTTTKLASSVNPSVKGQGVTFTATVTSQIAGLGTPTGSVQFAVDGTNLGSPVSLNGSGQATSPSVSTLAVGDHTITATYSGDTTFLGSSGSLKQTVNQASTSTSVSSSANPSTAGQAVTFTASVTVTTPGAGTPTATVQFSIDGSPFGSPVALNGSGQATSPSTSSLKPGIHTVTATYSGDTSFTGSSGTLSGGQTVNQAPAITSANHTTFTVGSAGSFMVTTTGFPTPTLSESGNLPTGVSFVDNGNGTATLSGTPAAGTAGSYPLIITASNGVGTPATQSFTLTVNQGTAITSASSTTFTVGSAGTFTVTATGSPSPSLTESGNLPAGVTFHDNGNGTATLSGTPAAGTGGIYPLIITASNGVGSPATQNFTLTVNQAPAITSGSSTTFQVGAPGSFTVTSTGFPTPSLTESGALPAGVSFVDQHNGTATLSGTPAAGTAGVYHLTITASNGVGSPATQSFTLTVIATTTTTLTSSVNPSLLHQPVTFTAAVSSAGGVPTGTVSFQVDGATVATVPLDSSGKASFTTSSLSVGSHTITAIYSGSSLFPGSSASLRQQVGYNICPIQLPFQGVTSGHIKIKLQLCDASGADLSSSAITLTVTGVSPNSGVPGPSGTFSFIPLLGGTNGGYQYSVDTTGYRSGTYNLLFTVAGDPVTHQVQFTVT